jgi:isopenicillin-N epimerase
MSDGPTANRYASRWLLDPAIAFLNHGSFGACPIEVLERQQELRNSLERQPVQFFVREFEGLLDAARTTVAGFLGADPQGFAWVPNATNGVNAVLGSLDLRPGDELLTTNHEYNACRNVLDYVCERAGARVVVADIPFPVASAGQVTEAIMDRVTAKTRLALLDHITSQTALVLPIAEIVGALAEQGVETLVDGAHAPGMLSLSLDDIGADYYTGNCHKWLCAPKGAGFLYVREDHRHQVRPPVISHGANSPRTDRSRYLTEFDWVGTDDPTAVLAVPDAIRCMGSMLPGGWDALREHNRRLALAARDLVCEALAIDAPCPDDMIGSLASFPLPDGDGTPSQSPLYADPLQDVLLDRFAIEVPVIPWPESPARLIRISAQIYNDLGQYERLGQALREIFAPS